MFKIAALNESETAYIENDYEKRIYTVDEPTVSRTVLSEEQAAL